MWPLALFIHVVITCMNSANGHTRFACSSHVRVDAHAKPTVFSGNHPCGFITSGAESTASPTVSGTEPTRNARHYRLCSVPGKDTHSSSRQEALLPKQNELAILLMCERDHRPVTLETLFDRERGEVARRRALPDRLNSSWLGMQRAHGSSVRELL